MCQLYMHDLPQKAMQIMETLHEHDGQANTREIREWSGISAALISHHTAVLQDAGLVEKVGIEDVGEPALVTMYALTDEGEGVATTTDDGPSRDGIVLQMHGRSDIVTGHSNQVRGYSNRLDTVEARIDILEEKVDHVIHLLEAAHNEK